MDRPNKKLIDDFLVILRKNYGTDICGYAASLGAMMAMLELALDSPEKAKKAMEIGTENMTEILKITETLTTKYRDGHL